MTDSKIVTVIEWSGPVGMLQRTRAVISEEDGLSTRIQFEYYTQDAVGDMVWCPLDLYPNKTSPEGSLMSLEKRLLYNLITSLSEEPITVKTMKKKIKV